MLTIDINIQDQDGLTALHIAVDSNFMVATQLLLAFPSIKLNIQAADGNTPLHIAAENGHTLIAKELVSATGVTLRGYG
jgi:ankyrin repeat protein